MAEQGATFGIVPRASDDAHVIDSPGTADTNATPELFLERNEKLAEELTYQNKHSSAVKARVRCVALSRIIYGDDDWRHARSLLMLARAYHGHTGRHDQTVHHAGQCRNLLVRLQGTSHGLPMEATKLLCHSHCLIGQSHLGEGQAAEAEKALTSAASVMQQCHALVGGAVDVQLRIKITSSLGKAYLLQKKVDKAKFVLHETLQFMEESCGGDMIEAAIPVWNSLAVAAQLSKEYSKSVELFRKAHAIAQGHYGNRSIHVAAGGQLLASAHLLLWQHDDANSQLLIDARKLLQESLEVYKQVQGVRNPSSLKCHKEYCRLLVLMEQHVEAISQLEQLIKLEKDTFGDISLEVGKSYQLLGTIRLSLGDMPQASSNFTQCQLIYRTVLGARHKDTKAVMVTLETLQLHEVASGKSKKERPRFKTVV